MRFMIYLPVLLICILTSQANAELAQTERAKLPTREASALENLVCESPHKLKAGTIEVYKSLDDKRPTLFHTALVKCESHGSFMGSPMNYQAFCDYIDGKWHCMQTELETTVKINDKPVTMLPSNITPEAAYQLLLKTSSYGMFQGIKLTDAIGSQCEISQSTEKETAILSCEKIITLSFWCPQPQLTHCPRVLSISNHPMF